MYLVCPKQNPSISCAPCKGYLGKMLIYNMLRKQHKDHKKIEQIVCIMRNRILYYLTRILKSRSEVMINLQSIVQSYSIQQKSQNRLTSISYTTVNQILKRNRSTMNQSRLHLWHKGISVTDILFTLHSRWHLLDIRWYSIIYKQTS